MKPKLEPRHKKNLEGLADFLVGDSINVRFDMSQFSTRMSNEASLWETRVDPKGALNECMSVACAVGCMPFVDPSCIVCTTTKVGDTSWKDVCEKFCGIKPDIGGCTNPDYVWMFDGYWAYTDNTKEGASARIRHYLKHGLPDSYRKQMEGEIPLCYEV